MVVHLTINTICFLVITYLYGRTLIVYFRRYGLKKTSRQWRPEEEPQPHQQRGKREKRRQHAALWRLVLLLAFFIAVWLLVIINDYSSTRAADFLEPPMGDAPSTLMVRCRDVLNVD